MDKRELEEKLKDFKAKAKEKNYPLRDVCIEEAYPGDASSSFVLKVSASWVDDMDCSEAINILTNILWDTVDENTRKSIFSIFILDSKAKFHCEEPLQG